jgi:hypothetical protein
MATSSFVNGWSLCSAVGAHASVTFAWWTQAFDDLAKSKEHMHRTPFYSLYQLLPQATTIMLSNG